MHAFPPRRGGGGVLSLEKGIPTLARLPESCGCHEPTLLKGRGYPVIINAYKELSNLFISGFYIR